MKEKLAIITTHPIQYFAPVFKLLANEHPIKVFYTWGLAGAEQKFDKDFGKKIEWDIPLLDGYEYEFLKNSSSNPGSHHFMGIQNPEIIDKIKAFNPSAILIYGWSYRSHLRAMRYFSGKIPVWFRGDSTLLDEKSSWKKSIRRMLLNWVYNSIDKAFYVGAANKAYFKEFGLKEHQLVFSPHAVDNDRFAEDRSNESKLIRRELGVHETEIILLFAGKLEWKKRPDLLLNEFVKLNIGHAHLLFVGNGELEESLKVTVGNLINLPSLPSKGEQYSSIKDRIHFMGFQNQSYMPVVYQACNIICLPSATETWGLVINEAMAAGKAILVSNKVGCAIDLVNESNGYVFSHEKELSDKLNTLLKDRERLDRMGLASKKLIANWTFQKQTNAISYELEDLKNG